MLNARAASATLVVCALCAGCAVAGEQEIETNRDQPSWEEFLEETYQEPWQGGVFIVDGDTPIEDEKKLQEFYHRLYGDGALAVQSSGGNDSRWSDSQKRDLTYCVSDAFGSRKQQVIDAIRAATDEGWELFADVDFIHVPSQDASCNPQNSAVLFDVRPVQNQPYMARAFFPGQARYSRNVLVNSSAFYGGVSLSGLLGHELGHALGFRHEHTRPEAGVCFEDTNFRPLTPYDSGSIMHYPHCNGTGTPLTFSTLDADGAAALYGPPPGEGSSGQEPAEEPPEEAPGDEPTGTPQSASDSGSLTEGQAVRYDPIPVVSGSVFEASITGTGDADLYVRFGAEPTVQAFDCRPFLTGSAESCTVDVPADASSAYLMVHGYSDATYTLEASWLAP